MRVKLRARGTKVNTPGPPPATTQFATGGDPTPVNSRREAYNGAVMGAVAFGQRPENIGKYVAPPKNEIWVRIPTTVAPTPLLGQQPFTRKCKGCG